MKKYILSMGCLLCACQVNADYILNETVFCTGLGQNTDEKVMCHDANNNPTNGKIKELSKSGHMRRYFMTKNGSPDGIWKEYKENGTPKFEGVYVDGDKHGVFVYYDEDGNTLYKIQYAKNKPIVHIFDGENVSAEELQDKVKKHTHDQCIKKNRLCRTEYVKGCKETGIGGKVVGFDKNGVILHFEPMCSGLLCGSPETVYLYTDKEYLSDQYVHNPGAYYEYVGLYQYVNVRGAKMRVRAYRETTAPETCE